MQPRIAASVLASSLVRRTEAEGGFAAVLAKGDPSAGSILLILMEKGRRVGLLERVLQSSDAYRWQQLISQVIENELEFQKFLLRRRNVDPDLWILELDIPSAERFAAEMISEG
jgi:hypothetical protein